MVGEAHDRGNFVGVFWRNDEDAIALYDKLRANERSQMFREIAEHRH
jgi:hypothetical protein